MAGKYVKGIPLLQHYLQTAPATPGVYRMLDEKGAVLYVGKARNLKARLTSYTRTEGLSNRIRRMVSQTQELILVECRNETEALLLEISLIKSLKPRYNVIFRDDASYPYIFISDEEAPRIRAHRGAKKEKGQYFGPYPSASGVHKTIDILESAFLLRSCAPSVFKNRSRPCLKYYIKRCSGPCVGKIEADKYTALVGETVDFLNGNGRGIQKKLEAEMLSFSEELRYEEAGVVRDRLKAVSGILESQGTFVEDLKDADILGAFVKGTKGCVQQFSYRGGQNVGHNVHFPKGEVESAEELLRSFLAMHYTPASAPKMIYISHALEELEIQALQEAFFEGGKVHILTPQRGEKRQLVQAAQKNAKNALERRMAQNASWQQNMEKFAETLGLEGVIECLECFDISNISGKQSVASMVVAGAEDMLKNAYRKFSVRCKDTPDDYAMMREVLERRYGGLLKETKQAKEKGEPAPVWPNVVMVDGGKGHLNVLVRVFEELGLNREEGAPLLCAIAKGKERNKGLERIFLQGAKEPLDVPYNSPLIFVLQRIRDESHRFAIGFHRQKRGSNISKSILDDIPSIGAKRKKALLLSFGSVDGVKNASLEDLAKVEGVSEVLAQTIFDFFHEA